MVRGGARVDVTAVESRRPPVRVVRRNDSVYVGRGKRTCSRQARQVQCAYVVGGSSKIHDGAVPIMPFALMRCDSRSTRTVRWREEGRLWHPSSPSSSLQSRPPRQKAHHAGCWRELIGEWHVSMAWRRRGGWARDKRVAVCQAEGRLRLRQVGASHSLRPPSSKPCLSR